MQFSRSLSELPVGSGDPLWPLRFIDARFEPHDPIFDAEDEPLRPRRRKRAPAATAAVIAATIACGGSDRPSIHAIDSILVQLEDGAAPPPHTGGDDSGPPIVALRSFSPEGDGSVLRVQLPPGTDPVAAAEQAARAPGVAFAEPVYIYQLSKTPNDPRFKDLWGLANIEYIVQTNGMQDVERILDRIAAGSSTEEALHEVLHCNYDDLMDSTAAYLRKNYSH